MEDAGVNEELSVRLKDLWSLMSAIDPADAERLLAPAEAQAQTSDHPQPPKKRAA